MTKEIGNRIFEVVTTIAGEKQTLQVKLTETSDGAPYYICLRNKEEVTQLRRELEGGWKQLWGDLNARDVTALGQAIDQYQR